MGPKASLPHACLFTFLTKRTSRLSERMSTLILIRMPLSPLDIRRAGLVTFKRSKMLVNFAAFYSGVPAKC